MSRSEAGKLGYEKTKDKLNQWSKEKSRLAKIKWRAKQCLQCGNMISYEKRQNKFCNKSCRTSYNNKQRTKKAYGKCKCCGTILIKRENIYCSMKCNKEYEDRLKWLYVNTYGEFVNPSIQAIKRLLIKFKGNQCMICDITEWRNNPVPLVLDHINGDAEDNSLSNLRVVCGNCDMQLPTYKGKNAGKGRHHRRQRYVEGKSY